MAAANLQQTVKRYRTAAHAELAAIWSASALFYLAEQRVSDVPVEVAFKLS
jgi:hypothetical protein